MTDLNSKALVLPVAWIVDVDGTLALHKERDPYDWQRSSADQPNMSVVQLVKALALYPEVSAIVAVTGREEIARPLTEEWLHRWGVPYDELHMRPDRDGRPDESLKEEMFRTKIKPKYAVAGVIDDRDRVVKMWRRIGLLCLQVADGDF